MKERIITQIEIWQLLPADNASPLVKIIHMKTSKGNSSLQSKQQRISHKPKPEIRDDMDSRKNRESGYRGTISKKGDRKKKS